jgi:hypothetical protein
LEKKKSEGAVRNGDRRFLGMIKERSGLYADKEIAKARGFKDIVLVTMGNTAFLRIYRNWECRVKALGMDWIFVALDDGALVSVNSRDDKRAILLKEALDNQYTIDNKPSQTIAKHQRFSSTGFNKLCCFKLDLVKRIIELSGHSVVLSDTDNVFKHDPFAASTSFGSMIESRMYDYIYQPNKRYDHPSSYREPKEANTGFHFVSSGSRAVSGSTRARLVRDNVTGAVKYTPYNFKLEIPNENVNKRDGMLALLLAGLGECRNAPSYDDQTNFWNAFRKMRIGSLGAQWDAGQFYRFEGAPRPFSSAIFCPTQPVLDPHKLSYCFMAPFEHPCGQFPMNQIGGRGPPGPRPLDAGVSSYHPNFCVKLGCKIRKLEWFGLWYYTKQVRANGESQWRCEANPPPVRVNVSKTTEGLLIYPGGVKVSITDPTRI